MTDLRRDVIHAVRSIAKMPLFFAVATMACHRTQFTPEVVQRVMSATAGAWNNATPLIPAVRAPAGTGLFE